MKIPLTKGMFATIDDDDAVLVLAYKWYAAKGANTWYAAHSTWNPRRTILMHNLILGDAPALGLLPDHKDGDGLNNSRSNLRWLTHAQNVHAGDLRPTNTSGFKGVSFCRQTGMWRASIRSQGRKITIGRYKTADEAASAYNRAAIEIFGDAATLNPYLCHRPEERP